MIGLTICKPTAPTNSPCSTPPAKACASMTVIELPAGAASRRHLQQVIGRHRFDPLGFVMFAFPWGKPGTALANEKGPEPWQREVLVRVGRGLKERDTSPD